MRAPRPLPALISAIALCAIASAELRGQGAVTPDVETKRRNALLNDIVADYLRTDPNAPPGYNDILIKAEAYINQRLDKANEPFRYDARKRAFVDRR
ncbi:hypothetical protein [Bradyrhizobium sp.]|uniref:hypothetical protein n=1 Tax=Bradyrhizobium sp. TaxID=376 RepID=UPI001DFFCF0C|nr:hypothetical protein [Bradyrhizobium sp.]MBI5322256.1 hypothetical protein [Bradyrhizobium sp.]